MTANHGSKHVGKNYFPHEVICSMLRHCERTAKGAVGFYQSATYATWSFRGKNIATGVFPAQALNSSFTIAGFGNYKETTIRGRRAVAYKNLGKTKVE